jgi:hypothetical protein
MIDCLAYLSGTGCYSIPEEGDQSLRMVECTTEITHHQPSASTKTSRVRITDVAQHEKLVECVFQELPGGAPTGQGVATSQDIAAPKREVEELDALNSVATILSSTHDLQGVLGLVIERARLLKRERDFMALPGRPSPERASASRMRRRSCHR